jgi:uncharacterized iron-regulated protein
MIDDVKKADIVLWERFTYDEHHRNQLAVISALHESGADMAIGLEMFRADSQDSSMAGPREPFWTGSSRSPG